MWRVHALNALVFVAQTNTALTLALIAVVDGEHAAPVVIAAAPTPE